MSLNGSGVAVINSAGQPVVATTLVTAVAFNALTADLATMISTCVMKDGQQTITADIPFNNNKITGLKLGTVRTDAASLATIQDGTGVYCATVGGTADVITLTPSPVITAYVAGQNFRFIASGGNTTNVTVNISGLGAKAVTRDGATVLIAGDIAASSMVQITYDGTEFVLGARASTTSGTWTPSVGGNATYTTQVGTWIKQGPVVFVTCALVINVIGTGSTSVISGLTHTSGGTQGLAIARTTNLSQNVVSVTAEVGNSTTSITIRSRTAAGVSDAANAVIGNGTEIVFSGFYKIN